MNLKWIYDLIALKKAGPTQCRKYWREEHFINLNNNKNITVIDAGKHFDLKSTTDCDFQFPYDNFYSYFLHFAKISQEKELISLSISLPWLVRQISKHHHHQQQPTYLKLHTFTPNASLQLDIHPVRVFLCQNSTLEKRDSERLRVTLSLSSVPVQPLNTASPFWTLGSITISQFGEKGSRVDLLAVAAKPE